MKRLLRTLAALELLTEQSPGRFELAPAGALLRTELYLLRSIVHDWDDERAAAILRNCRRAIPEHGRHR